MDFMNLVSLWAALGDSGQLIAIVLLALQVLDVLSTRLALSLGFSEANPIARVLMRQLGVVLGLVVLKTLGAALIFWQLSAIPVTSVTLPVHLFGLSTACVLYLLVVGNNLSLTWWWMSKWSPNPGLRTFIRMLTKGREVTA